MTDYRLVMGLLVQGYAYRQIEAMAGCSHRAIARARRVLDEEGFTTREQVDGLSLEDIDRLFADGRRSVVEEFVPVDIEKVVAARLGRNKPPLKVLWARYLETGAPAGARLYGYERFCQIVAEHVRVNDLTLPIAHVPAHTMQVDWAGTQMHLTDPITRETTRVSVFVASLPFSGMVFAYGCLDEKQPAWLDAHRRAFEYFGGVTQVIVPDNASTASNQISRTEKARDVNAAYAEFLEHYRTAAVPTRSYRPRDRGHVEAGVKVVTNWVIHYLADRVFASLDELNTAVAAQVDAINDRTPFRGESRSRRDWFTEHEQGELLSLPVRRWGAGGLAEGEGSPGLAYPARHDQVLRPTPVRRPHRRCPGHRGADRRALRRGDHRHPPARPAPQRLRHRPRARARARGDGVGALDARVLPPAGVEGRPRHSRGVDEAAGWEGDRGAGLPVLHEHPRPRRARQPGPARASLPRLG